MIMDHLDQSNKPVNSECCEKYISAEAQIRYLKRRSLCLFRLNLNLSLSYQHFAYALLRFPSQVRKTSLIIPVFVATIMNGGGLDFSGFDLTKTSPAVLLRPGNLVGFVITAQPSSFNVNAIRSIWYKCQPWTYLWFRETLTANIISRRLGWNTTVRCLFLH